MTSYVIIYYINNNRGHSLYCLGNVPSLCCNLMKGGISLKITFIKEVILSKKKNESFYFIKLALIDEKGQVIAKSNDVALWLTKEQYDALKI